jgi:hypothetical protein
MRAPVREYRGGRHKVSAEIGKKIMPSDLRGIFKFFVVSRFGQFSGANSNLAASFQADPFEDAWRRAITPDNGG